MKPNKTIMPIVAAVLMMTACGGKQTAVPLGKADAGEAEELGLPGDSTVYGLTCDGSNDTILVFLPSDCSDPDTFYILGASRNRQVFGHPMIGDKVAVVVDPANPKVADMVIDLKELKGEWCYLVQPELRQRAGVNMATQLQELREASDSAYKKLMQPREYGFEIKSDYVARPIGMTYNMTSDEESPVIFPPLKRYRQWHILNGLLVLSETRRDSTGALNVINNDTARFVMMRRDTLVLRFSDGTQHGYYRKQVQQEP